MATSKLNIARGKTLQLVIRWEAPPLISIPITAIATGTGFPRLTVTGHGAPNGWRGYIVGVQAPKQINAKSNPPRSSDHHELTVIDANTVELNGVIPVDDAGKPWAAYTSGGFLQFNTPQSLAGATVRVKIKDRVGGTVLLSTETADSPNNLITATADDATKTITIEISAAATAALTWSKGVWEVEIETAAGKVFSLVEVSLVVVSDEVVTS